MCYSATLSLMIEVESRSPETEFTAAITPIYPFRIHTMRPLNASNLRVSIFVQAVTNQPLTIIASLRDVPCTMVQVEVAAIIRSLPTIVSF